MCGRFSNTLGPEEIAAQIGDQLGFNVRTSAGTKARNIAPTEQVLAVVTPGVGAPQGQASEASERPSEEASARAPGSLRSVGAPEPKLLRWALLPDWASDLKGRPHINARLETVKKAGKFIGVPADAAHRALIVADEFLEWSKAESKGKSRPAPFGFSVKGGAALCFAGLWSTNERVDRGPVDSCTILTCDARGNRLLAPIHDRMPVMLADPELWRAWLDPSVSAAEALSLCGPLPAERMSVRPLPLAYNDARNKEPEGEGAAMLTRSDAEERSEQPQLRLV